MFDYTAKDKAMSSTPRGSHGGWAGSTPLLQHLQNTGLLGCNCTSPSFRASPGLSSGTWAMPDSDKPQLLSMSPSCLQNQYYLGDSYNN